jgi:CubicO group peptidase (beta-lactamase class C family)
VTSDTHFLVASTTKSMSSLLVATYVDEGKLAWDQRVIDAWPGFGAPTDELTNTLRVRDLLGMASGIGEPSALSGLHEGDPTAGQLLQSIVNLPVIAPPGE